MHDDDFDNRDMSQDVCAVENGEWWTKQNEMINVCMIVLTS